MAWAVSTALYNPYTTSYCPCSARHTKTLNSHGVRATSQVSRSGISGLDFNDSVGEDSLFKSEVRRLDFNKDDSVGNSREQTEFEGTERRLSSRYQQPGYRAPRSDLLDKRTSRTSTKWTPDIGRADEVSKRVRDALNGDVSIEVALQNWKEQLSSRTIVAVLNSFSDWQKGLEFFNWVKSHEDICEITIYTYNVMLKLLRDGQQWNLSEQLLSEMISKNITPDNYTFSIFVSCAKRCARAEGAVKWFHKLAEAGVTFDEVTFSSMIDLYGRAGRTAEAMDLYQSLRKNSWKPDMVTFGTMANVYSKVGDYQAIMSLFRDMEDVGMRPNVVLFNTLIGTLSKAGKVNLAKSMFEEMERYGVEPSEVTLSILLDMYAKVGAVDRAFEVYETIKQKNWRCDVMVYNTFLKSCVDSGNVDGAEGVLKEMQRVGCPPDHMTYGAMMNIFATKGLVTEAREMFNKVKELSIVPKTPFYTMLIKACKQAKEFRKIPDIFEEMMANGCSPDERMSGMLLSCATSPHVDDDSRLAIINCIRITNARLHGILSCLLDRKANLDKLAGDIHDFLFQDVTAMSRKALCNSLIDFCWVLGFKDAAQRILETGISAGLYPGLHTNLPSIWQLNLRTLSFAAAECALEAWVRRLFAALEEGEEFPEDLMVETGVGRAREALNAARLTDVVGLMLKRMDSPFEENRNPTGYFIATGSAVKCWLESTKARMPQP